MVIYLDWLLNKFNKYRQSIGLSFFFTGLPMVYFLRDGLKLAPGSSAFTAAFTIFSLLLAFPQNPKRLYSTNTIGYLFCILYGIMALIYLALYAPNRGWFTNTPVEIVNQLVLFTALFIFAGISINTLKDSFVQFTLLFCVIGGLSLIYYIARNPAYVIGMRAAISFGDDGGMGSMGNPHIYAKSAYIGVVAGIVLLRNETRQLWRWVYYGSVFILLIVIGLCQSMAIVMVTGIFFALYFISNLKTQTIYKSLKWVFGWEKKGFKDKKNPDLWMRFLKIYRKHKIKFVWVKGHASNKENNRCDELAVEAATGGNLKIDVGYEKENKGGGLF